MFAVSTLVVLSVLVTGCIDDIFTSVNVYVQVYKAPRPGVPQFSAYPNVTVYSCDANGNVIERPSVTNANGVATITVKGGTQWVYLKFDLYTASPIKTIHTPLYQVRLPDVPPGTREVWTQYFQFSDDPYLYPAPKMQPDSTWIADSTTAVQLLAN